MVRKLRRFMVMFVAAILYLETSLAVLADEQPAMLSEDEKGFLNEALYGVEMQKEMLGFADMHFDELSLGEAYQTYVYRDGEFEPYLCMYPIMDHGKLVLWAIEANETIQLTQALVEEVVGAVGNNQKFTIVYDRNSVYLYANNQFTLLAVSPIEDESRSVLNVELSGDYMLKTTALSGRTDWEYEPVVIREPVYYGCDVKFVSQNPPSKLCWAATIACIANYKYGDLLTAVSVAQGYYGASDYNKDLHDSFVPDILAKYRLSYAYEDKVPSNNVILENVRDGYPLYTSWVAPGVRHAVCLYGINSVSGLIYVMDPEFGFATASYSGGSYTYVNSYWGTTLTLNRAVCHSW